MVTIFVIIFLLAKKFLQRSNLLTTFQFIIKEFIEREYIQNNSENNYTTK